MIRKDPSNLLSEPISIFLKRKFPEKLLKLHSCFALGSPEKVTLEPSPHKILLEGEAKYAIETVETSEKFSKDEEDSGNQPVKEPKVKAMKAKRKLNVNQSLNQDSSQNHKLTEYFAVRRSVRKPKTAILEEKQRNLEESVLSGKEDGLQVQFQILLLFIILILKSTFFKNYY